MGIKGYATIEGTENYFRMKNISLEKTRLSKYFRSLPMAMGTFMGDFSEVDSKKYEESLIYGLENGVNFIDTAICYRGMLSERDVGKVLKNMIIDNKKIKRDEIIVSSKAGIIFGDITIPLRPLDYLDNIFIKEGILKREDVNIDESKNLKHTLAPNFHKYAIDKSKENLGLDTIDVYYIHEPEWSKSIIGEDKFYKQLELLFEFYEGQVECGNIMNYGIATWSALTCNENNLEYLSLEKIVNIAKNVAGDKHYLKFLQLNYNKINTNANTLKNQKVHGSYYTAIDAANELGIIVNVNGPLNQMKDIKEKNYSTEEMLKFITDTKGVHASMIGNKKIEHLKENMRIFI